MAENWKPIKLYVYLGSSTPPESTTRETVLEYLNGTDPDAIERAGRSYVEAAKLVQGDAGVQGAVMKAAASLASVWRGGDAAQALKALRLLHASAGALGQAMKQTGEPLTKYAGEVRRYRTMVAGLPTVTNPNPGLLNSGNNAGGTGVTDWTTPPLLNSGTGGGLNGTPLLGLQRRQGGQEAPRRAQHEDLRAEQPDRRGARLPDAEHHPAGGGHQEGRRSRPRLRHEGAQGDDRVLERRRHERRPRRQRPGRLIRLGPAGRRHAGSRRPARRRRREQAGPGPGQGPGRTRPGRLPTTRTHPNSPATTAPSSRSSSSRPPRIRTATVGRFPR